MKQELIDLFGVRSDRVTLIPYGINNIVPESDLTPEAAKARLRRPRGGQDDPRFREYRVLQGARLSGYRFRATGGQRARLPPDHRWQAEARCDGVLGQRSDESGASCSASESDRLTIWDIPDPETEVYFKAADVSGAALPRDLSERRPFLASSFGLPVVLPPTSGHSQTT